MGMYALQTAVGETLLNITGRDEWALRQLLKAGQKGCTPIENPAPRWSAYVFKLRRMGLDIETITETHGGSYPGHHARYVLKSVILEVESIHDI